MPKAIPGWRQTNADAHFAVLRGMASLEEASDAAVRWLAATVVPRSFADGEALIREGELDRDCYFIVEGSTDVSAGGELLGETGPGQPEGEMALFFNRPRGCTTVARGPVSTLHLHAEHFDQLRTDDRPLADGLQGAVLRHLARRFNPK